MVSGKAHARIGLLSCIALWGTDMATEGAFKPSGIIFCLLGALLAKWPDIDLDVKLGFSHRNPLTHSALLPGILTPLVLIYAPEYVAFLSYFNCAVASHLLADLGGAFGRKWKWAVAAASGVLLTILAVLGVIL